MSVVRVDDGAASGSAGRRRRGVVGRERGQGRATGRPRSTVMRPGVNGRRHAQSGPCGPNCDHRPWPRTRGIAARSRSLVVQVDCPAIRDLTTHAPKPGIPRRRSCPHTVDGAAQISVSAENASMPPGLTLCHRARTGLLLRRLLRAAMCRTPGRLSTDGQALTGHPHPSNSSSDFGASRAVPRRQQQFLPVGVPAQDRRRMR